MGFVVANIGTAQNVPVWDIRCDTLADIDKLDAKRIPTSSTVLVMETTQVFMLNSQGTWIELGASSSGG